jgi:hypothetical protein
MPIATTLIVQTGPQRCHGPGRVWSSSIEINICPRWILAKLHIPEQNLHHVAILISTIFVLLLVPVIPHVPHFCLMKKVLGIPCPGCGISHALMAVFHFDPVTAWRANPAGIGVAAVFLLQIMARPLAIAVPRKAGLVSSISRYASNLAMLVLLLVWTYRVF